MVLLALGVPPPGNRDGPWVRRADFKLRIAMIPDLGPEDLLLGTWQGTGSRWESSVILLGSGV